MRYDDWKSIIRESSPLIALMMFIEIGGGSVLQSMSDVFYALPALLALVPMINAIGGNAGSIIGSRLASGLHLGIIEPSIKDREVMDNILMTGILGVSSKLISSAFLFITLPLIGIAIGMNIWVWFSITLIASSIVLSCVLPAAVIASIFAFSKGKSPDDFTIPIVSTVGDFTGILGLLLAIKMVGI